MSRACEPTMFCSTVIATIARPTLDRAVQSVLNQAFTEADFEIVVVNDAGRPLPQAAWQASPRVQVLHTARRERCVARNTGAAIAQGRYLHFLDDDDCLLPGALARFWRLAEGGDAAWLYGATQLVDRQGRPLIELRHDLAANCFVQVMAGEWIPLQASLIAAGAFFQAGGFDPLLAGAEDVDLCRRVALRDDFRGMDELVACVGMGQEGSSTDVSRQPALSRRARETILNRRGAWGRMRASAHNSYWQGRIARAYLTSTVWNLRRWRPAAAASRAAFGLASLALSGRGLFSADFWRAVARPYHSFSFRPAGPPAHASER